ncbi:hypothetical protein QBC40DRAFT_270814 [Triangularia verruculosa]|uniref:VWFA domain-containing protein n=1 Tax=Triangularia verruculosa TaxID=2587418 RepID=A0AAN6XSF9_9PEZI|nr:hypothetical protein QBC40DRAFT_270814 [Triangularia verruculosa]
MASLQPEIRGRSRASSAASSIMSNSSKRSFLGSIKDKVKRSSRSHSPNPNKSSHNPFNTPAPVTASDMAAGAPPPLPTGAPPPYSEQPLPNPSISINQPPTTQHRSPSPSPSATSILSTPEDPYAFLSLFDTIFLIDDSGSMNSQNRWKETKTALAAIAPICAAHDSDGVDVYFLNSKNYSHPSTGFIGRRTAPSINQLFSDVRPDGWTPTGSRIKNILGPYVKKYVEAVKKRGADPDNTGIKPVNLIVITDGAASDDPEGVIVNLARKLDEVDAPSHQVGIQFFQVGNDAEAGKALSELDDGLKGVRDMVDTVSFDQRASWADGGGKTLSADAILKTVLGAVVKRLDRRTVGERQGGLLAPRS